MIVTTPIKVEASTHHIVFTPSDDGDEIVSTVPDVAVTVTNLSQVFASFQVALHVEGQNPNDTGEWYKVEPNVGAKKPPGDRTTFYIRLTKPPIPAYGTTIPAKLTVFSAELSNVDVSQPLYIQILRPSKTLRVYVPLQDLQVTPGSRLRIPVLVYNLNPTPRNVTVRLQGLELDWLPETFEQSLWIEAGSSAETEFWCAPAAIPINLQQVRPFTIEATDDEGNSASIGNKLEILPFGYTAVTVDEAEQVLPATTSRWSLQRQQIAHYLFQIQNRSNVSQTIVLQPKQTDASVASSPVTVAAAAAVDHDFAITARRPLIGWRQTQLVEVWPQLTYRDSAEPLANVNVQPASQLLTLKLRPVIPWWVQLLLLLLGCLGLGWLWLLSPRPLHTEPVNSIALMSNGDTVASGSRDQTLRRWQVSHGAWLPNVRRLKFRTKIETQDHRFRSAIRVIEPLPANNKQIAVGLENGDIQLWNVDPPEYKPSFLDGITGLDKVFDLAFTQNSRYLFSGHGSGQVYQWDMQRQEKRGKPLYLGATVVSALDVIEPVPGESWVAIAAQFNRLVLWDWQQERAYDIRYTWPEGNHENAPAIPPVISSNSYLTGLDVADGGTRMVTADSVGFITLWDVNSLIQCARAATQRSPLADKTEENSHQLLLADCEIAKLQQWPQNTNGQAVRDVAITANGCYVAGTGDNGHIDLWQIDNNNQLRPFNLAHIPKRSLNTVDIHLTTNDGERPNRNDIVLVAADTANHRVQLYRKALSPNRCQ
ncbi:wd40 repeat-containing protein [Leptolyngbya sp. Heron Island J]|uniref:WD40 repeat domain-containing protein n=1 Tax=Leptolyngbya sp. Heron Island J TaxID=1385935 RepID=UPI0003B94D24|nr:WD40 repeat domain-containing protein [Leptolyngbya sp. Heron Island J]ESA38855.1 wd40 repeat-containing protein [Leptolyngbya sp. Heron Island J]